MTAIETEALTAMIYIFIAFAIGLAVFDQYRKLKVSFQKVKKANEPNQTKSQTTRHQSIQECNCPCCCCCLCLGDNCVCGCQYHACRRNHERRCGKHLHDEFGNSSD